MVKKGEITQDPGNQGWFLKAGNNDIQFKKQHTT